MSYSRSSCSTVASVQEVVARLEGTPRDLVRTGDTACADLAVDEASLTSPARTVELLIEHPELMQRPLVVRGERAVIGRPPERVLELLD